MNLKNILKNLKLNENNISMLLGAAVIVVVGFLIVNYFKNLENGTTLPAGSTTSEEARITLPTKHTVAEGESLWSIAEKYYRSGYNWVDIQKENNLTNASVISNGQELIIPDVAAKTATTTEEPEVATGTAQPTIAEASPTATPVVTATPAATPTETITPTETKGGEEVTPAAPSSETISGDSYTVVHGDSLWTIAERAYGDGFKWTQIAEANKLAHPGTIHTGNVLTLPR